MKETKKVSKLVFIILTTLVAVIILSATVGKELYEGRGQSLFSFGLIHFSGYLFFILMPVEMAFIYYLSYFNVYEMVIVAMVTAVIAQVIDYYIGYLVSEKVIHNYIGEKRIAKAEKYINKYGNLTIFVFNVLPLSSPVIALVAGMLKYSFRNLMIYHFLGLLIKYIVLCLLFSNTNWF